MSDQTHGPYQEPGADEASAELGAPTMAHAIIVWIASGVAMFLASGLVWTIAGAVAVAAGVDPKLLGDPHASPLFTSALAVGLLTFFVQLVLVASLVCALWLLKPSRSVVLPFVRPHAAAVAGGALVVFGLWPFAGAAADAMHRFTGTDLTSSRIISLAAHDANLGELGLLYLALAVVPALAEESMFRGFITAPFLRASPVIGTLVPAVMFGVFHLEPVQAAGTIVLGVGFGLARVYSGSLIPGMVAHCLYNGAVITLARSGIDTDDRGTPWWVFGLGALVFGVGMLLLSISRARRGAS